MFAAGREHSPDEGPCSGSTGLRRGGRHSGTRRSALEFWTAFTGSFLHCLLSEVDSNPFLVPVPGCGGRWWQIRGACRLCRGGCSAVWVPGGEAETLECSCGGSHGGAASVIGRCCFSEEKCQIGKEGRPRQLGRGMSPGACDSSLALGPQETPATVPWPPGCVLH